MRGNRHHWETYKECLCPPCTSDCRFMSLFQCGVSGMFILDPGSRIPDPGSYFFPSRILLFSIPDPGFELSPSRILAPHQSILTSKKAKKWFLSSKKYDPGCSSRIPDPGSGYRISPMPDPGSRGQKGTQSRIPDPDPQH